MNKRQIKKITESNLLLEQAVDLSKEGKFQLAIEILTKSVALNPKLVSAYSQRANAYRKLGSERLAIDDDARAASIEFYGAALVDVPSSMENPNIGRILWGLLWIAVGSLLALVTKSNAGPGEIYFIFVGPIIWGGIITFRGVLGLITGNDSDD
jgi:tetratricopeptide (TPR) repeat protein